MILIRRVRPDEADTFTHIALAAKRHWGYPERWMEIWTPQLTVTPAYFEAHESWAAEAEGRPVAFYTLLQQDGIAWIENLWVHPGFIGKEVGRCLFLHALNIARGRGDKVIRLEADPNAVGFYEKMGMHKISERHSEVDGLPRILPVLEMKI